jgi:hypothetical protein
VRVVIRRSLFLSYGARKKKIAIYATRFQVEFKFFLLLNRPRNLLNCLRGRSNSSLTPIRKT